MKDFEFTLEREEILRALRQEYEPLGLRVLDLREVGDTMIAELTPSAAPGPRLETRLDDVELAAAIGRHALRVIGFRVLRTERVAEGELRVWAQLADGRCPACGQDVAGAVHGTPETVAAAPSNAAPVAAVAPPAPTPVTTSPDPRPGTMGRTLPVPARTLHAHDHEVVTVTPLRPRVVAETQTTHGPVERLEVDIPADMEVNGA